MALAQLEGHKEVTIWLKVNYAKAGDKAEAYGIVKEGITPDTISKYKVTADFLMMMLGKKS